MFPVRTACDSVVLILVRNVKIFEIFLGKKDDVLLRRLLPRVTVRVRTGILSVLLGILPVCFQTGGHGGERGGMGIAGTDNQTFPSFVSSITSSA